MKSKKTSVVSKSAERALRSIFHKKYIVDYIDDVPIYVNDEFVIEKELFSPMVMKSPIVGSVIIITSTLFKERETDRNFYNFVIGHEYAHLVLGHLDNFDKKKKVEMILDDINAEIEADKYSAKRFNFNKKIRNSFINRCVKGVFDFMVLVGDVTKEEEKDFMTTPEIKEMRTKRINAN